MDMETTYLTALLAIGLPCGAILAGEWLYKKIDKHSRLLSAKRLHDCKPGAFMVTKQQDWEDLE
jgi:hypothetical protein